MGYGIAYVRTLHPTHLRHQADKCRRHANALSDPRTQEELRKLAAEYEVRAEEIESKEKAGTVLF
jgi:hypothetical protein